MSEAKGMEKLEACVEALCTSERFSLAEAPKDFPVDSCIFDAFGFKQEGCSRDGTLEDVGILEAAWKAHAQSWRPDIHGKYTTAEAIEYWERVAKSSSTSHLGNAALHALLRPTSAAACERIFSFLTPMDSPNRRSMGSELLCDLLMLRGNADTVQYLLADSAQQLRTSALDEKRAALKRNNDELLAKGARRHKGCFQDAAHISHKNSSRSFVSGRNRARGRIT